MKDIVADESVIYMVDSLILYYVGAWDCDDD